MGSDGWYAGIDPGNGGAIAFYNPTTGRLDIHDMPTHEICVSKKVRRRVDVHALAGLLADYPTRRILLESVGAMPKQGVSSTFTFGFGFGAVQGVLAALHRPMQLITPPAWKKAMGLSGDKDASRRLASRELPQHAAHWPLKKHDGRAEAALLALLCARTHGPR